MDPYYSDDQTTLYLGDCREVWPALAVEPDLVIADPPYGETSLTWDRWPDGWVSLAADYAASMWCFGSMRMFLNHYAEFDPYFNLSQDVVWEKQNGTGFASDRFRRVHEFALHFYRGGWNLIHHETPRVEVGIREPGRTIKQGRDHAGHWGKISEGSWVDDGTRLARSVIKAPNMWRRGAIHPTEKSLEILEPLIEYACPPGGLVLDPFAGSGSTAAYARSTGRRSILIESNEKYCDAIAVRLSQGLLGFEGAS